MSAKTIFVALRDGYVIRQAQKAKLPPFGNGEPCRWRVTFSERVQKVGFRLEVCELAKRLSLTGYCRNLENGDVLAELQGPQENIQFLISFMESLKRIRIREKIIEELELIPTETEFMQK